jgi:hypothetical protein
MQIKNLHTCENLHLRLFKEIPSTHYLYVYMFMYPHFSFWLPCEIPNLITLQCSLQITYFKHCCKNI